MMMKNMKIAVIGMGYVGIPAAVLLANAGYNVTGIQRRSTRSGWKIDWLNQGKCPIGGNEPELPQMLANEEAHERELITLLDEERLKYVGSVVLGLNDALVEFTGTLAGLTFAIQNARIIAVAGLIMGVAASLSMGASEYLSRRSDDSPADPFRAAVYTGATYIVTVALLILPFLVLASPYLALAFTLAGAVLVIFLFTFYISVAKDLPFWRRFAEMTAISLGIAAISFVIGLVIRVFLNVNV